MVVLGVVLILLAIAAAIAATVNEPTASTTITVFDRAFEVTATQMFVLGIITAALFLLGLALLLKGMQRARARRRELRHARSDVRDRVARLEEEKRELQRRLENARPTGDTTAPGRTTSTEPTTGGRGAGGGRGSTPAREEAAHGEPEPSSAPRSFFDRLVGTRREGGPRR